MNYLHIMFFIIAIPLVGMDNDSDHRENEVQKRIHIDIPTQDNEVRHPRPRRWLDECGRLKGDWLNSFC